MIRASRLRIIATPHLPRLQISFARHGEESEIHQLPVVSHHSGSPAALPSKVTSIFLLFMNWSTFLNFRCETSHILTREPLCQAVHPIKSFSIFFYQSLRSLLVTVMWSFLWTGFVWANLFQHIPNNVETHWVISRNFIPPSYYNIHLPNWASFCSKLSLCLCACAATSSSDGLKAQALGKRKKGTQWGPVSCRSQQSDW